MLGKFYLLFVTIGLSGLFMGCGDDDHCGTNVDGCPTDYYSCPEAARCYSTKSGCASSGECG